MSDLPDDMAEAIARQRGRWHERSGSEEATMSDTLYRKNRDEFGSNHFDVGPEYDPRRVARNRGSCSCTWKGPWRLTVEQAQEDLDYHIPRPFGPREVYGGDDGDV
jgi:hypothetical protein